MAEQKCARFGVCKINQNPPQIVIAGLDPAIQSYGLKMIARSIEAIERHETGLNVGNPALDPRVKPGDDD